MKTAEKNRLYSSPWFGVSMAIIGMIAGYTFMLLNTEDAFASGKVCNGAHKDTVAASDTAE